MSGIRTAAIAALVSSTLTFVVFTAVTTAPASAATVEISFTGMDLVYDGSAIYDAGSTAGGLANPANADALTSITFSVNGAPAGTLLSNISADIFIPGVTGIPAGSNVIHAQTTVGNPGFFDLLIGASPLASQFLIIDLAEVEITYTDTLNVAQFVFGIAVSDVFAQNLPFGLVIDEPITVSFSAQVVPRTLTNDGSHITGFAASGSGNVSESGTTVPEPAAGPLFAVGLVALLTGRRRKARKMWEQACSMGRMRTLVTAALVSSTVSFVAASTAGAGVLNGHSAAFGAVTGSVPFNDAAGLAGWVDYAVFTAATFNANFAGLGYVPGDALVYAYQINSLGPVDVTGLAVALAGAANTIGSFDLGGIAPSSSAFVGSEAQWLFPPRLSDDQTSWGLAFSSPDLPIVGLVEIFGGATPAIIAGPPTPFTAQVPEPHAIGPVLTAALAALGWSRRRRRAR